MAKIKGDYKFAECFMAVLFLIFRLDNQAGIEWVSRLMIGLHVFWRFRELSYGYKLKFLIVRILTYKSQQPV